MSKKIYLLYGEDTYSLENYVKKFKKDFGELVLGINFIQLDEKTVKNLISDASTPAFGFSEKLILIKNSNLFKKDAKKNIEKEELQKLLIDYIENESFDDTTIMFVEDDVNKFKLYKTIEKIGTIKEFTHKTEAQIKTEIKRIINAYKVNITDNNIEYIMSICGTNMQDLINEIRKLIEYKGSGGTIEKEDIDKLCIKKTEAVIFDLTDALGQRNIKKSFEILENLIYQKEPLQLILIMLYRHFKNLFLVKQCINLNRDVMTNVSTIKMPFLVKKYKDQAGRFSDEKLKEILEKLTLLDMNSKIGLVDLRIGLDTILCSI